MPLQRLPLNRSVVHDQPGEGANGAHWPHPLQPQRRDDHQIRARSISKYDRNAARYDQTCGPTWAIRLQAISALGLRRGDHVLDVGCGTGLSLPFLSQAVGPEGRVTGFDQSPAMFALARARCEREGWRQVDLHLCGAQEFDLAQPVDALLFHYAHDILRSPAAIERLLALARPGARVAIAGIKYFSGWLTVLNPWVYFKNMGYNGAPGELRSPWDRIAPHLSDWRVAPTQFGMGFLASGRVPVAGGPANTRADPP